MTRDEMREEFAALKQMVADLKEAVLEMKDNQQSGKTVVCTDHFNRISWNSRLIGGLWFAVCGITGAWVWLYKLVVSLHPMKQ